ncbi:MAG TPA: MMPL family transporter [Woeseiaceae bacterium]|nr:MMPL family transporter [Woeseiaceae bacterium]
MRKAALSLYDSLVLGRPVITLLIAALAVGLLASRAPDFALDTSSDSLLLESDTGIRYYRAIRARYGSDDFLILTYTPSGDLFSEAVLDDLGGLRDDLAGAPGVASVVSILDVPLLQSPPLGPRELADGAPTLLSAQVDRELAREELTTSPLYRNRLMSPDGNTTALQVNLEQDETYTKLLNRRADLREIRLERNLTAEESAALAEVERRIRERRESQQAQLQRTIAAVRDIVDDYRDGTELHLGGLPMIAADLVDFIRRDLIMFGIGLAVALVALLAVIFRRPRWVVLPLATCAAAVLGMIGFLGLVQWPVTVVSSNFVSLMLILTLSLNVHLVVRHRELHREQPNAGQRELVRATVRNKFYPALYTALTTMVAFGSLVVSDIRPVIDFGWMMVIGMAMAFVLTFLILPASLMLLAPGEPPESSDFTNRITGLFSRLIGSAPRATLAGYALIAVASTAGVLQLSVDNRFIDYFKQTTAIYQGMKVIDERLGGTTPLDVILDADPAFVSDQEDEQQQADELELPGEPGLAARSYWYNATRSDLLRQAHEHLESRPDIGKVLSLSTTLEVIRQVMDEEELDNFQLSVIYKRLPEEVKEVLFEPYLAVEGHQTRIAARVYETSDTLERDELLESIRRYLAEDLGLGEERVHLTGLMVLYNNVLQSLLGSQITTAGVVTVAVVLMFWLSFRSLAVAVVALVPNLVAASAVLALMSAMGVPLDIMTITIAAIAIGIGVDDTIHYVYRFQEEFAKDGDYDATIERCHRSIGHAMYYTSITIMLGFSILALSNFVPTIYFGLLTGLAMAVALVANLSLLPLLFSRLHVLGRPD